MEAYRALGVIQHWAIQYKRCTVQGEPETGHVALKSDDTSLHLYFAEGSAQTARSKRELVERLSSFCGFSNANNMELDRKYLLMNILEDDDLDEIDAMLDRERVPSLVSDDDLANEAERKEKARQVRLRSTATGNALLTTRLGGIPAARIDNLFLFSVNDWDPSTFVDTDRLIFAHELKSRNTSSGRIGCIPLFCNLRLFGSGGRRFWRRGLGTIVPDDRTVSEGEIFVSSQQSLYASVEKLISSALALGFHDAWEYTWYQIRAG